jgi:hypothetical protein
MDGREAGCILIYTALQDKGFFSFTFYRKFKLNEIEIVG